MPVRRLRKRRCTGCASASAEAAQAPVQRLRKRQCRGLQGSSGKERESWGGVRAQRWERWWERGDGLPQWRAPHPQQRAQRTHTHRERHRDAERLESELGAAPARLVYDMSRAPMSPPSPPMPVVRFIATAAGARARSAPDRWAATLFGASQRELKKKLAQAYCSQVGS